MPSNRMKLRGSVLVEDRRTERFVRELLATLGFDKRKFIFNTAPSGLGDAAAWVRAQYPHKVNLLRRKRHQRLCLLAVRDGDNVGVNARKVDLDLALAEKGLSARDRDERIGTPVPTWSIETWLLVLLGDASLEEGNTRKLDFERGYSEREEGLALRGAARAWADNAKLPPLPSLVDGKIEMSRLDF